MHLHYSLLKLNEKNMFLYVEMCFEVAKKPFIINQSITIMEDNNQTELTFGNCPSLNPSRNTLAFKGNNSLQNTRTRTISGEHRHLII